MAKRRTFVRVDQLLGEVLGQVANQTGSAATLTPVWRAAVGDLVASHARCAALRGEVLVIVCDGPLWRDELASREEELLGRLRAALSGRGPARLSFELEGGPASGAERR